MCHTINPLAESEQKFSLHLLVSTSEGAQLLAIPLLKELGESALRIGVEKAIASTPEGRYHDIRDHLDAAIRSIGE